MKPKLTTRILKYLLITSTAIAIAYALIWIALQGYAAPWTGFGDFTKPSGDFVRGKTLWDWMQLFIIPIFLSVGVFLLNRSERESEREIAADRQKETALQTYFDRMADLLLKEQIRTTDNPEALQVARIRTLSVLRSLDPKRKRMVLLFLCESGLIATTLNNYIILQDADLSSAFLKAAHLVLARLSGANLTGADLTRARLAYADLTFADLTGANLTSADLTEAILGAADLSKANLRDAKVTNEQLATVKSLKGTTMPDGTIHE